MASRFTVTVLLALAGAALPSAAVPQTAMSTTTTAAIATIARSAGNCPATIPIVVTTKQYQGGDTTDLTAHTMATAFTAVLISATRKEIVFDAELRPAYASCQGTGRTADGMHRFVLHHGRLGYTITLARGAEADNVALIDVGVVRGLPHATVSFAD